MSYSNTGLNNTIQIKDQNHYYPFGLKHKGYNTEQSLAYKYKFNHQEWQQEFGLNVTAMDFRQYDNALGRFHNMDALAASMPSSTPYHFGFNNPVYWADPSGLASVSTGVAWLDGLFNNSGSGVTTWTNEGNGIWTTNGNENGGAGFFNTNIGVFTAFEPLAAVVIPKGVSFSSNRFWNIANGHTYWNSTFYANWRSKEFSRQLDQLQSGLDWLGAVPILGEPVDLINAGISAIRGDYAAAGLSLAATVPIAGWGATAIKIQRHHIIPQAVYKKAGAAVQDAMKLNAGNNLKKIPTPFHGNHPQYNSYVSQRLNQMQNVTPGSIQTLQKDLNGMINNAYDNYKATGQNLNNYFRQFNGN